MMPLMLKRNLLCLTLVISLLLVPSAAQSSVGFPKSPQRIVSMNLCTDELLLRLADPEQLVGVTFYPKTPEGMTVLNEAAHIKYVKGELEEVLALEPDLVITGVFTHKETARFLENLGIPVLTMQVPQNFREIYDNILTVAQAVGHPQRGNQTVIEMRERLSKVKPLTKARQVVFYQRGAYVPGAGTFEHAILESFGARNLAADYGIEGYGRIDLETLITLDPDMIVFLRDEENTVSVGRDLLKHPVFEKRFADTQKEVLPSYLFHCGAPMSVEAVELLAQAARKGSS